ncbi:MAG TPA: saccharopine dehydrogenase NADP-binding domain-containing protein, partial [Solirubrobacteraceae bacterium]|nr:saccharopine dehydrogenase NADP-binding domain-containing protein [Solirubrobacteraceae bacterium]
MALFAVYGATGYTGRLVAAELRDRGLDAVLCGRNGGKLRRLADELGVEWPVRAAAVDDAPALRKALSGADAVINCAGPFTFYGAPVIEAALDVGAHYIDTAGEQPYIGRVFEHMGGAASAAGRAVVPAVGFDYLPGDLIAALTARGHEPLDEIVIAYYVTGFGMSRGTLRSGLEMLSSDDIEYRDGDWHRAGRPRVYDTFDFGEPIGSQPVVRYPGGEIVTVPRHVETREVRYRWATTAFAPHPALK